MGMLNVAKAADELLNAILGGDHRETLSARSYRLGTLRGVHGWRIAQALIDALFFFQPDHCHRSFLYELDRRGSPREYR